MSFRYTTPLFSIAFLSDVSVDPGQQIDLSLFGHGDGLAQLEMTVITDRGTFSRFVPWHRSKPKKSFLSGETSFQIGTAANITLTARTAVKVSAVKLRLLMGDEETLVIPFREATFPFEVCDGDNLTIQAAPF